MPISRPTWTPFLPAWRRLAWLLTARAWLKGCPVTPCSYRFRRTLGLGSSFAWLGDSCRGSHVGIMVNTPVDALATCACSGHFDAWLRLPAFCECGEVVAADLGWLWLLPRASGRPGFVFSIPERSTRLRRPPLLLPRRRYLPPCADGQHPVY